jgi:hypothetical protein
VAGLLLTGLCAVLGAALAVTLAVGGVRVADARHRLTTLQKARDVQAAQDRAASARQQDDLRAADLAGKLRQVKDLDGSVDAQFSQWWSGSVKFGVLQRAIIACENAIDAYDRAVAPFPESLLPGGMPPQVNTANPETDCGRAFTGRL